MALPPPTAATSTGALATLVQRSQAPRAMLARALRAVRPAAWVIAAAGGLALGIGLRAGWVELRIIGGCLLLIVLVAVAYTVGRHPYEVSLALSDRRVVVGERAMAGITVRNTASRPVLASRVQVPVGADDVGYPLPALRPGGDHEEVFAIPTARRGVVALGPVATVRGDPLDLLRRAVAWGEAQELYVHPRTVHLSTSAAGFIHDLEGRATQQITSADLSFHALREYVPGDDRRYVHWRTSARTGKLMVRQFEESRRSHLVAGMTREAVHYGDEEEFETAISVLGSLALAAMTEDKDLTALTSLEQLGVASRGQLLDELTRMATYRGQGDVVALAHRITREAEDASMVVLVTGSNVDASALRSAAAVLPLGARCFAVQANPASDTRVTRLGALTLLEISGLDELPRAFRRAMYR